MDKKISSFGTDPGCPNCVDDSTGRSGNRWTMPLQRLGDKQYYLGIFFKANWYKSEQYCRFHGMHLASINTAEEQRDLQDHIQAYGMGHEHFWTSGTDQGEGENSSGWEQENLLPIKIGTLANQTTFNTRMENKNTVWKCGIAMEKAWDGTILLVVFQHFSFARLNQSQDAKSYLLYGLICIPFSHIYLAYCGRALQTKIQFYKSLSKKK